MDETKKNEKIAVYPGTFDPVTFGHIDIIERASNLFDSIIVAAVKNSSKKMLFTPEERIQMIEESVSGMNNVTVESFGGLLVNYANSKNAATIIRGLRTISDFEYELQMDLTNRKIGNGITTVFLMPGEKYSYISSTLVKEIAKLKGDVSSFIPGNAVKLIKSKYL